MIVVTGRMVQSLRRVLEPAGLDEPVICYQGAVVADADGRWLLHVPIELELAREAIAAVGAEGYEPNVYVDDELYVARVTPEAEAYASFQDSRSTPSATSSRGSTATPTKLVCVGEPERARRARRPHARALRRPAARHEVAAVLPRVRDGRCHEGLRARLPRRAPGLHARSGRSRSATARTTSS